MSGAALATRDFHNDGLLATIKWGLAGGFTMWAAEQLVTWDSAKRANRWQWLVSQASIGIKWAGKAIPWGSEYVRATTLIGISIGVIKGLLVNRDENRALTVVKEAIAVGGPRFVDSYIADGILQVAAW
jgi:hypothetical protein